MEPLSVAACRALGSLLEKQVTVPTTYPLTLNAVVAAANQTTGRDPVLELTADQVQAGLDELRQAGLVRLVHPSHGARMVKYRQVATEALGLDAPGLAVLTVLLLRGAQTPGELRSRSDRLHAFDSVDEVETTLQRLADHEVRLVEPRPRQPGHKELRWIHLLGPVGPVGTDERRPATTEPGDDTPHPALAGLAPFLGRWVGRGEGWYPTIDDFSYTEEIELQAVPGKPLVAYRSSTWAADDGRALHGESGFLRPVGPDQLELVIAQGAGLVEIAEGLVIHGGDGGSEIMLASTMVAGTSTAKEVTATERRYQVDGGRLTYELAMAAVGQPLSGHLRGELHRA